MNSNSKDKQPKQSKPPKVLPFMTPRNLVPATPMRFNSTADEPVKKPIAQVQGKEKKAVPLPPGYVDRAAQRRQGLDSAINFEDLKIVVPKVSHEDETKNKLKFLEESEGLSGFPNCSNESTERLMNFILKRTVKENPVNDLFRPNEAFLQFKSIEESKTQPFDPFHRPKQVFRATRSKSHEQGSFDDEQVFERVKEAVGRLKTSAERNQKYLVALSATASATQETDGDIFPEAGRFDEKAALESVIKSKEKEQKEQIGSKSKAKDRLFGSSKKSAPVQQKQEQEIDVFELIAQKSLDETENKNKEEETSGGLFGFTEFLPKLSRLDSNDSKANSSKLTGAYASILSDNENEADETVTAKEKALPEDEDDYLYPGYLENDPMAFDSDGEAVEDDAKPTHGKGQKRKMARKEDKEAAKVEKLVKTKFGVDLTK